MSSRALRPEPTTTSASPLIHKSFGCGSAPANGFYACLIKSQRRVKTLRELAARDPLTGLWNHSSIIDLLVNELNRADRQGAYVGVVLADLDRFKSINDTYGHLSAIMYCAKRHRSCRTPIRPYDAVGRLGGEEFLVILPGCDQINAVSHAERLRSGDQSPRRQHAVWPAAFYGQFRRHCCWAGKPSRCANGHRNCRCRHVRREACRPRSCRIRSDERRHRSGHLAATPS